MYLIHFSTNFDRQFTWDPRKLPINKEKLIMGSLAENLQYK